MFMFNVYLLGALTDFVNFYKKTHFLLIIFIFRWMDGKLFIDLLAIKTKPALVVWMTSRGACGTYKWPAVPELTLLIVMFGVLAQGR